MKKIFSSALVGIASLTPIAFCIAQSNSISNPIGPQNMDLTTLIAQLLKIVAMIGGIVCVFFIIYAGFLFVVAQGKPEEIQKAKTTLLWSVIGAAVLLGASVIAEVIKGTVEGVTNIRLPR